MQFAQSLAEEAEPDKFERLQRYWIFIDKMHQLYKSDVKNRRKIANRQRDMTFAHVSSLKPLKDILRAYNESVVRGFNGELIVKTLQQLKTALEARGNNPKTYEDYRLDELDISWRMQKLVDDISYNLQPGQFFAPKHLGEVCQLLGEIGYKNTDLIPLVL